MLFTFTEEQWPSDMGQGIDVNITISHEGTEIVTYKEIDVPPTAFPLLSEGRTYEEIIYSPLFPLWVKGMVQDYVNSK
jgi:hypothetical protein